MDMRRWEIRYRKDNKEHYYYVHASDKAEAERIFNNELYYVFAEIISIIERTEDYENNLHS